MSFPYEVYQILPFIRNVGSPTPVLVNPDVLLDAVRHIFRLYMNRWEVIDKELLFSRFRSDTDMRTGRVLLHFIDWTFKGFAGEKEWVPRLEQVIEFKNRVFLRQCNFNKTEEEERLCNKVLDDVATYLESWLTTMHQSIVSEWLQSRPFE